MISINTNTTNNTTTKLRDHLRASGRLYPNASDIIITMSASKSIGGEQSQSESFMNATNWKTWESSRRPSETCLLIDEDIVDPFLMQHMRIEDSSGEADLVNTAPRSASPTNPALEQEQEQDIHEVAISATEASSTASREEEEIPRTKNIVVSPARESKLKKAWKKLFKGGRSKRKGQRKGRSTHQRDASFTDRTMDDGHSRELVHE